MALLKRPLTLIGIVLLLILAALAAIPFFIPTDVYRTQIEQAATRALDREVTLGEDVSLGLFPRLSARVDGVQIANPEGFSRPHMLTAGELRGVVRWGPLFGGRVEISEFVFDEADLRLERLESGEANWEFAAATPEPEQPTDTGPAEAPAASVDTARLTNATVSFTDATTGASHTVSDLNIMANMASMDAPLTVEAGGRYEDNPFTTDLTLASLSAFLEGDTTELTLNAAILGADMAFDGALTGGETPALNGTFDADIEALPPLLALASIDPGYNLAPIGRISASGAIAGPMDALDLTGLTATTNGSAFESRFTGGLTLADPVTVQGDVAVSSDDLGAGLAAMGIDLPVEARLLEALDATLTVAGPVDALRFTGIDVTHRGDLLNAAFEGAVGLGGDGSLDGQLSASSTALRSMFDALGSPLPEGDTLNTFDLSTSLSGTFSAVRATGLSATLDDTTATGDASVDLTGDRPAVTADLTIPTLTLDTFLVESEDSAEPAASGQGWSDAAIDLAGLEAADIDLRLRSDQVSLGDIVLSNANLDADIEDGRLTAVIDQAGLFGGQWSGRVSLDGSSATPRAQIALDGTAVAIDNALATLAGLDSIGGLGRVRLDLDTSGGTVADMVSALSGTVGANLADGQVKGFNVAQLVRSRDNIAQALTDGSLALALSPEAETDFTAFDTEIRFDNGIGSLTSLNFTNPLLLFDGSGQIDLPNQTIDLSIIPKVDENAAGQGTSTIAVDGIPIPLRLNGSWFSPSIAPDTRLLQQSLQAAAVDEVRSRAADALGDTLGDSLGGDAGAILDGVLGTGTPRTAETEAQTDPDAADPDTAAEAAPDAAAPPTVEDAARDLVRDRIGGLFGRDPEPEDDPTPDER